MAASAKPSSFLSIVTSGGAIQKRRLSKTEQSEIELSAITEAG
jgi:hypothetical protein